MNFTSHRTKLGDQFIFIHYITIIPSYFITISKEGFMTILTLMNLAITGQIRLTTNEKTQSIDILTHLTIQVMKGIRIAIM